MLVLLTLLLMQLPAAAPPLTLPALSQLTPPARSLAFVPGDADVARAQHFQASGLGGTLHFSASGVDLHRGAHGTSGFALRFVGAAATVKLQPSDQQPGVVHLMLGNDPAAWRTHLPTFAALHYTQLYPGIDLRYDGTVTAFKGTYSVAAGADPAQIRWRYADAGALTVDQAGNLHIPTAEGAMLTEAAPIAWQERGERREPVTVRYALAADDSVSFVLGAYDRTQPLTIDPVLSYSTYVGGTGNENGQAVVAAGDGSVYIVGTTSGGPFLVGNNASPSTNLGSAPMSGTNVFVSKLDDTGTLVDTTFLGGSSDDSGAAIALDASGAVYLTGTTLSSDFPITTPITTTTPSLVRGGARDAFMVKLTSDLDTLSYGAYVGGAANDYGYGIATNGGTATSVVNVYVVGRTDSGNFPVTTGTGTFKGKGDAFLTIINPATGAVGYSRYLGGNGGDYSTAVAVDGSGAAYLTGYTDSPDFPTLGSNQYVSPGGRSDAFLMKLNFSGTAGSLVYSIYLGGADVDYGNALAVDTNGGVYLTGVTSSTNFPRSSAFRTAPAGASDAFVTKFNFGTSGATLAYSTYLGGENSDSGHGITVDTSNNAYVTGTTNSTAFHKVGDSQARLNGGTDAFITKLSGSALSYSTYLGGTSTDGGAGIAVDSEGGVYVTGQTSSSDLPFVNDANSNYRGGVSDAFVMKVDLGTQPRLFLNSAATVVGAGQTFDVNLQASPSGNLMDTVEAHLEFDPAYLEVKLITSTLPIVDNKDTNANANVLHEYNNNLPRGRVDLLAWNTAGFAAETVVATIRFKAKSPTPVTRITLIRNGAHQSDLLDGGKSINPILGGGTVRILPGALLQGEVSLIQRGDSTLTPSRWITDLSRVTTNTTYGGIKVYQDGTFLQEFRATTDRQGAFAVSLDGLRGDDGLYDITVKGDTTLSILKASEPFTDTTFPPIKFGELQVGDSTGDDQINGADASYLVPSFGRRTIDAGFLPYGDINKDGIVDIKDAEALGGNFLEVGADKALSASSGSGLRASSRGSSPQTATASVPALSFSPAEHVVKPGDVFTMTLLLDVPSTPADTVDVYMSLMTEFVELVGDDGNLATQVTLDPAVGGHVTYNKVTEPDNGLQRVNLSITRFTTPFFTGRVPIATLRFRAKKSVRETKLELVRDGVRRSDVLNGGASLQPTLGVGTVKILGVYLEHVLYLPSVER